MSAAPSFAAADARLQVDYVQAPLSQVLAGDDVLAVIGFGDTAPESADPRVLRVGLQPFGAAPLEVWRSRGPVVHGREGDVAWAEDGALQFGVVEIDEPRNGRGGEDIAAAAEQAYRTMLAFTARRGYGRLLRIWNYLDAITLGEGDAERYRHFCMGRAAGLGAFEPGSLPAATAIGRVDGERRLQVYWLAGKLPGMPLENPRQLSAYRYPRRYGPQPPSFARAMLPPAGARMPLLLSGTAAIVGHESRHADSVDTQLDETFANFDSLIAAARVHRPGLPAQFGPGSRLKVYVRDADELPHVADLLDRRLPPGLPRVLLQAQVCRRELRVEIDGVHDGP
jgi:chorismate lyase/3-hydroxybenzoate synthase